MLSLVLLFLLYYPGSIREYPDIVNNAVLSHYQRGSIICEGLLAMR